MEHNGQNRLFDLFLNSGFFSINESRILSILIITSEDLTVKEICQDLSIPDSKIYPALNELIDKKLIIKNQNQRPSTYYITDATVIINYLNSNLETEYQQKKSLNSELSELILNTWTPSVNSNLGQVAYVFRANMIENEVIRLTRVSQKRITMFLSAKSLTYIKKIPKILMQLIGNGVKLDLALPNHLEFIRQFDEALQYPELRIKFNKITENSYIVVDDQYLLKITHNPRGDVAILTNDELLVSSITDCWGLEACCEPATQDLVELTLNL